MDMFVTGQQRGQCKKQVRPEEIKTLDKDFILWGNLFLKRRRMKVSSQMMMADMDEGEHNIMKKLQDVRRLMQKKTVNLLQMKLDGMEKIK